MPAWAWVLSIVLALGCILALALALLRFHYFLEWRGQWDGALSGSSAGTARVETRFLWFKHVWEPLKDPSWSLGDLFRDDDPEDKKEEPGQAENSEGRKSGGTPEPEPGFSEAPARNSEDPVFLKAAGNQIPRDEKPSGKNPSIKKSKSDPNRTRRTLFRLLTDPDAWKLLGRFGLKVLRLALKLLRPRIEAAIGHPDPVLLGRVAGNWYAVRPFLPLGSTQLYFRFQDRSPSLWVRVQGAFSALSVLGFGLRLLIAFPSIRLARRALHGWRRHRLTGWRAWVYRKLQTAG